MKIFATFTIMAVACFGAASSDKNQVRLPTMDEKNVSIDNTGLATDKTTEKPVTALIVYSSPTNGKIECTYDYRNGLRDGFQRVYNLEGKEIFKGEWKLGKTAGLQTEFYPEGQKLREYPFSDGNMNGDYSEWYANGGKKVSGQYAKSRKVGRWLHYNEEGVVDEILNFKNGLVVSEIISFEEIEELHTASRSLREKLIKERDAADSKR